MVSPIPSRRTFLADSALIAGSALFLENTGVSAMASPLENQEARKKLLQQCLGGPWPEGAPLDAKVEKTEQKDGYQLIRVNYLVEPTERIAAWLLIPDKVDAKNKAPGICLWHQHAGQYDVGKDEPAGVRSPNFAKMHMTGVALAKGDAKPSLSGKGASFSHSLCCNTSKAMLTNNVSIPLLSKVNL